MCATLIDACSAGVARAARPGSGQRGFSLPELIAVLVLVGIVGVVAIPKLQGVLSFRDAGWRDQIVAALHHAQAVATSHRRLVCATIASDRVTLTIASTNPASSCDTALPGVDGQTLAAASNGGAVASVSPAGPLYFQPSGRVSADAAATSTPARTITITDQTPIVLVGETGHVE